MLKLFRHDANKKRRLIIRLGKKPIQIQDEETEVEVKFFGASKIIDDRKFTYEGPSNMLVQEPNYYRPNYYKVVAWTNTEAMYQTRKVDGLNFVSKTDSCSFNNQVLSIPLEDSIQAEYLYVELHKGLQWRDPGPSDGIVVIGHGKIPLPSLNSRGMFGGKVSLVGLNSDRCVVEKAVLEYALRLQRYVVDDED